MRPPTVLLQGLLALSLCGAPACAKRADGGDKALSPEPPALTLDEVGAMMDRAKQGTLALAIYDCNAKDWYENGHVPGARWLSSQEARPEDLPADKATTLVFYCSNEH